MGVTIDSGFYQTEKLPDTARQALIFPNHYAIGGRIPNLLNAHNAQAVTQMANLGEHAEREGYSRAFIKGQMVMGTSYKRSQKRCNSVVSFLDHHNRTQFLRVHSFHVVRAGDQVKFLALGKKFIKDNSSFIAPVPAIGLTQDRLKVFNDQFTKVSIK